MSWRVRRVSAMALMPSWMAGRFSMIHGQLGLAGEGLVAGDQPGECGGLLPVALGHAIILGNGLRGDLALEGADGAAEALEGLRAGDGGGIVAGFLTRQGRKELAAIIRLGGLNAFTRGAEEESDFCADEEIIRAELILFAVEVVAPAVEEVDSDLLERAGIVEGGGGHVRGLNAAAGAGNVSAGYLRWDGGGRLLRLIADGRRRGRLEAGLRAKRVEAGGLATDLEGDAGGGIGSGDEAAVGHLDGEIVADGLDGRETDGLKRDELAHALVLREDEDFDVIEQDAVDGEKIAEVSFDALANLEDALVDLLHARDLDDLVDGLLDGGAGVVGDLGGIDDIAIEREMSDELEGGFASIDVDVVIDLVSHLGHLGAGGDALAADEEF